MKGKQEPKSIATINFKGGVGKTTVTWCLGDLLSTFGKSKRAALRLGRADVADPSNHPE
jgi:MinD-like ATPase involved in chromosome partitioning or flagellar assembly